MLRPFVERLRDGCGEGCAASGRALLGSKAYRRIAEPPCGDMLERTGCEIRNLSQHGSRVGLETQGALATS